MSTAFKREELLATLAKLKPALGDQLSIYQHFWCDGRHVCAINGAWGIRAPLTVDFSGGVPGLQVLGLLASSTVDKIELAKVDASVQLKLGHARPVLPLLLTRDGKNPWVFGDKVPKDAVSLTLTDELMDALALACVINVKKPTRVEHDGVVLYPDSPNKGEMELVSTNGNVLIDVRVKGKFPKELRDLVLVRGFLVELLKHASKGDKVLVTKDEIVAQLGDLELRSKKRDEHRPPDLVKIIDGIVDGNKSVPLPVLFSEGIKRAGIVSKGLESEEQKTASEEFVDILLSKEDLRMQGTYMNGSVLNERMKLTKPGYEAKIKVGLDYLSDFTERASTLAIAERALILRDDNGATFLVGRRD